MDKELSTNAVGGATTPEINNPKSIRVEEAANGFILRFNSRRDWNARTHIANTNDDVIALIKDYSASDN